MRASQKLLLTHVSSCMSSLQGLHVSYYSMFQASMVSRTHAIHAKTILFYSRYSAACAHANELISHVPDAFNFWGTNQ